MPIIQVTLVKGRPQGQVHSFIRAIAEAAIEHLHAPESAVRVMVNEVEPDRFAVGTKLKSELITTKEGV